MKLTPKQTRYIRPVIGAILLLIGLVSMFLPFLPLGYLFSLAGLVLLASRIPILQRLLSYLEKKDKKGKVKEVNEKISEVEEKIETKISSNNESAN